MWRQNKGFLKKAKEIRSNIISAKFEENVASE